MFWPSASRPSRSRFRPSLESLEDRRLPATLIAAGSDRLSPPLVKVFNEQQQEVGSFFAFSPLFNGGVRVAVGDVNGDGTLDVIAAAGFGAPHVKVIDGRRLGQVQTDGQIADTALLGSFYAFTPGFLNGVFVAAGDTNGDGRDDIIVSAGQGASPHVVVVNGALVNQLQSNGQITDASLLASFFAFDPAYSGGVTVASDDVTSDGRADVVVGAASNAPGFVRVIDGIGLGSVLSNGLIDPNVVAFSFFAYDPNLNGGVFVAAGDVNFDGRADIITAPAAPGNGNIRVFSGQNGQLVSSFLARSVTPGRGVRIASADVTGDGRAEIITGPDRGDLPAVVIYDSFTGIPRSVLTPFFFTGGGIFVGAVTR